MQSRKIRTSWRFTEIQIEKGSTRVYNSLDRHTKKGLVHQTRWTFLYVFGVAESESGDVLTRSGRISFL